MAIPVKFDKARAEYLLDCLKNGKEIKPRNNEGWTGNDMLALAGACFCGAMSQGPEAWAQETKSFKSKAVEHREAAEAKFDVNLLAAIAFYGQLAMLVADEKYDHSNESESLALVSAREFSGQTFAPVRGFKGMKNLMDG